MIRGGDYPLRLRAGVYHDRFLRLLAADNICVLHERPYFEHLDYHFRPSDAKFAPSILYELR